MGTGTSRGCAIAAVDVDFWPQFGSTSTALGAASITMASFATPETLFARPETSLRTVYLLRALNPLAFVLTLVVNSLGKPLTGNSVPEISAAHPTAITPDVWAFAIWGLIYLGQALLFLVYEFTPFVNKGLVFHRVGFWHVATCATSWTWTFVFCSEHLWAAAVCLFGTLSCLSTIYWRIHTADGLSGAQLRAHRSWLEYSTVYVPFSLYTSWVLGATLIGLFAAVGASPDESQYGGVAALTFAAFANVMVLVWTRDTWFSAVNVWTLVAIAGRHGDLAYIWSASVALAGLVGACTVVAAILNLAELLTKPKLEDDAASSEPLLASSA